MDRRRLIVVGCAAFAAIAAIFLMRALLGGGTTKVAAAPQPKVETSEVLVASSALQPGTKLDPAMVRWQEWPKKSVDASFLTHETVPDVAKYSEKAVVRSPLVSGEPITDTKVVQSDTAGFMAATLTPGMRAVSVGISVETGAGGFILPNDRVDVIMTRHSPDANETGGNDFQTRVILNNVRVLAIDQTVENKSDTSKTGSDNGSETVIGQTATLELSSEQAQILTVAQQSSDRLTLALRSVADSHPSPADAAADATDLIGNTKQNGAVTVIRDGVVRDVSSIR